jgi:hypothetical protein
LGLRDGGDTDRTDCADRIRIRGIFDGEGDRPREGGVMPNGGIAAESGGESRSFVERMGTDAYRRYRVVVPEEGEAKAAPSSI